MIRTAALIAAAALAAITATPAAAQERGHVRQAALVGSSPLLSGPGGCEGFNQALADAVATQLRRGDRAEARRLMRLRQVCAGR